MSFQEELEKILDEQFKRLDGTTVLPIYNRPTAVDQALTSIINLVDKEVIGEDQKMPPNSGMYPDTFGIRNKLRAEQRNKLRGE